ncbi:MAG TPA: serine/threonine-protein kinase, partial [Gemmatimonadaceae bacterium]|nr:serine/threonine-protein kinase [Gemmatimonadaceae bacterium]
MSTRWYAEWHERLRFGLGRALLGRPSAGDLMLEVLEHRPEERAALLDRACAGDTALRRDVETLLAAHEAPGILDRPVARFAHLVVPSPPVEGRTVGRYELREQIGSGGMGIVHRAWDMALGRAVALKFLPSHLGDDTDARQRFRVEAQAVAALDHPNICAIHEIGETDDGLLFIAMPYYEGDTVRARIRRGPLPVGEAVAIVRQAAEGLGAAHARGIV